MKENESLAPSQVKSSTLMPVGVDHFGELVRYRESKTQKSYLFVDKTLFIDKIMSDGAKIVVLTRPRRFGKTLNLSMLQHFLAKEVNGEPTQGLFDGLKISKIPSLMKEQGQYPVIFLCLKDIKVPSFELALAEFKNLIWKLFIEHRYLVDQNFIKKPEELDYYTSILNETAPLEKWTSSIEFLSRLLEKAYGKKAYILIDEYDTSIQYAYIEGYYDQWIKEVIRPFFGKTLKGNTHLQKGIVTGILRVSKESLFSGVNNLTMDSLLSVKVGKNKGSDYADCLR